LEYKDVEDTSVYVEPPLPIPALKGKFDFAQRQVSFLIWTTTPWTLPANLAIAVHPMWSTPSSLAIRIGT
jgi:isoleucyl-tRNA synthetase